VPRPTSRQILDIPMEKSPHLSGQGELLGSRLCPESLCLALNTTEQNLALSSYTFLQGFIDMGEIPPSSFCFRLSSPSSLSLFSQ